MESEFKAWWIVRDGEKKGPFSRSALSNMAQNGELTAGDRFWKEGLQSPIHWEALHDPEHIPAHAAHELAPPNHALSEDGQKGIDRAAESKVVPLFAICIISMVVLIFRLPREQMNFVPDPVYAGNILQTIEIAGVLATIAGMYIARWLLATGVDGELTSKQSSAQPYILVFLGFAGLFGCAGIALPKSILQDRNDRLGEPFETVVSVTGGEVTGGRGPTYYILHVSSESVPEFDLYVNKNDYKQLPIRAQLHLGGTRSKYGFYVQRWSRVTPS